MILTERSLVTITDLLAQIQQVPTASCTKSWRIELLPCTSKYHLLLGCFSEYLKKYLRITFSVPRDETIFLLDSRVKNITSEWPEFRSLLFHFLAILKFLKVFFSFFFFSLQLYGDIIDIQHCRSLGYTVWRFDACVYYKMIRQVC